MIDNKLKNRGKNCKFICGTRIALHQSILKYQTFSASMLSPFHWSVERRTFFPKRVFPGPFARLATYMPFCIIFQPFYIFQLSVSFLKFMWQKKRNKICLSSLTILTPWPSHLFGVPKRNTMYWPNITHYNHKVMSDHTSHKWWENSDMSSKKLELKRMKIFMLRISFQRNEVYKHSFCDTFLNWLRIPIFEVV